MDDQAKLLEMQIRICLENDTAPLLCESNSKVGVALNVKQTDLWPLNGLRINPLSDTCGWYLWRGEWSDAHDFFQPLHIEHLSEWCPDALPYLQLPPGWRFLLAPGQVDVWRDAELEL